MDVGESVTLVVLLSKALKYLTTSKTSSRALNRGLDQVGCRLHMERSDSERKTFAILNSSCNRQRRLVKKFKLTRRVWRCESEREVPGGVDVKGSMQASVHVQPRKLGVAADAFEHRGSRVVDAVTFN
jgi:hypothetical protein